MDKREQIDEIERVRKEAVKEFAEKLKNVLNSCIVEIDVDGFIDDLLKEFEKWVIIRSALYVGIRLMTANVILEVLLILTEAKEEKWYRTIYTF